MANKYIQAYKTNAEYQAASKTSPNVSFVYATDKIYYDGDEHQLPTDYSTKYLTFVALEDGTFKFSGSSIDYSLDGGVTWTTLNSNTNSPTVQSGSTIMWKGNARGSLFGSKSFISSGNFNVQGNIMSFLNGDSFINSELPNETYVLSNIFKSCTKLISAENLVLPAKTLIYGCYEGMFNGCTSLITAPQLPATTLTNSCYQSMFYGCTSLNSVTCLATDLGFSSTNNWLSGVAANGTFTKAASMSSWTSGVSGIPENWTVQDYQG